MNTHTRALILALLAVAAPVFAQQPVDEKDVPPAVREQFRKQMEEKAKAREAAANAATPAKPAERPIPSVKSTDPDVQALVKLLSGTFVSAPVGDTPELSLSSVVITVDGIDNAVYFELARKDSAWAPYRQGVWQVWKKNGALTVRQYDFTDVPGTFKAAIVGLWAAPDMFPVLKSTQLAPIADITLTNAGGNYSGTGTGPTLINGAFEFSTSWIITADALSFTDRGTDAAGKQVWGPAAGAAGPTFKHAPSPVTVERRTGGVVTIDFVPPSPTQRKQEDYCEIAATLAGYADNGAEFFNSSTPRPNGAVEPYRWTPPAKDAPPPARPNGMQGLNIGLAGSTVGTIRRVYVPAALGFGPNRSGVVQPNSDLIFSTQVQWIGEPKPPAAPTPPTPAAAPVPGAPVPAAAVTAKSVTPPAPSPEKVPVKPAQ